MVINRPHNGQSTSHTSTRHIVDRVHTTQSRQPSLMITHSPVVTSLTLTRHAPS